MNQYIKSLVIIVLAVAGVQAQSASKPDAPLTIDAKQREHAVEAMLKEFNDRYVFPDVALKVKETITSRMKNKDFDNIQTGQELAAEMTRQIQEITKDKHVRVLCSTKPYPKQIERRMAPSAEELKKYREEMRINNAGFEKVERLTGNIGYIKLNGFMDPEAGREPLTAAMTFLKNTDALILDLRQNGGGTPMMVRDVCSYFFGETPILLNQMYFRKDNRKEEFWTNKEVPGPRYLNKDVYILTSAFTFSGAEECAYNFQTQKRATLVGEVTGGGAHPGGTVPVADHYSIFIPTGRAINPITNTNWEGVGVKPDIEVDADKALETAHAHAIKTLLKSKDSKIRERVQQDVDSAASRSKRIAERRQANLKDRQAKTKQ